MILSLTGLANDIEADGPIVVEKPVGADLQPDIGVLAPRAEKVIPDESDFLFGYATVFGYFSYRDTSLGSIYIQKLTKNLEKYADRYVCLLRLIILLWLTNHIGWNFDFFQTLVKNMVKFMDFLLFYKVWENWMAGFNFWCLVKNMVKFVDFLRFTMFEKDGWLAWNQITLSK